MVDVAEGAGPADRLHNLLLGMAGRVDDDAINSAREMLGAGQLDAAAEFLTGCLVAGRIPVTSTEQYHLRRLLDEVRSEQALAERLHTVESIPDQEHRFSDYDEPDRDLAEALAPIAGRLNGVRAVWCAWRTTPAGVTYGAVPQRVLLAEVGSDGSVAAAGYQLIEALRRAGLGCSVDVFASGSELPEYHRNALAASRRVHLDMPVITSGQNGANRARAPRAGSGGTATESAGGRDLPSEPPAPPEPERSFGFSGFPGKPERSEAPEPVGAPEPAEVFEPAETSEAFEPAKAPEPAEVVEVPEVPQAPEVAEFASESLAAEQQDTPPAGIPAAVAEVDTAPAEQEETPEGGEQDRAEASNNMRVPAAVDAKLTDRERNLLRKLHEELAQREQDRDSGSGRQSSSETQDSGVPLPGTGGFPPISATGANQNQSNQQPS